LEAFQYSDSLHVAVELLPLGASANVVVFANSVVVPDLRRRRKLADELYIGVGRFYPV
jgi:hypothetical protein